MTDMNITEVSERFKADHYAAGLTGIEILEVNDQHVKTRLAVESKHMNALGIMQGGALFTLADFTFAIAINPNPEEVAVAVECHISFLKPVSTGVLYAESQMIARSRSFTACDITITNETGELVAKFHGRGFVRRKE